MQSNIPIVNSDAKRNRENDENCAKNDSQRHKTEIPSSATRLAQIKHNLTLSGQDHLIALLDKDSGGDLFNEVSFLHFH